MVNSVNSDGLFLDLLRHVEKLERKVNIELSPHRYYHSIDLLSFVRFYCCERSEQYPILYGVPISIFRNC